MEFFAALNGLRAVIKSVIWNPGFPRRAESIQSTAASHGNTVMDQGAVPEAPYVHRVRFVFEQAAAAGESMTFDLNYEAPGASGVPLLAEPFVYDETTPPGVYEPALAANLEHTALQAGGFFICARTYVAGEGPSMQLSAAVVDYYGDAAP